MIFKFDCPRCQIAFQIESKYLVNKDCVSCPNCELNYPSEKLSGLKRAASLFDSSSNADVTFEQHGTCFATFKVSLYPSLEEEKNLTS